MLLIFTEVWTPDPNPQHRPLTKEVAVLTWSDFPYLITQTDQKQSLLLLVVAGVRRDVWSEIRITIYKGLIIEESVSANFNLFQHGILVPFSVVVDWMIQFNQNKKAKNVIRAVNNM